MKNSYYVIGVMSGTSLDGLDLAYCHFQKKKSKWDFTILEGITINYAKAFKNKLANAHLLSAIDLAALDVELGQFIGRQIINFKTKHAIQQVDLIASHGHTIFHQPHKGITVQIGSGAIIAAVTSTDTVCDFRTVDVALKGQGAPLVPIGDELLFADYDACLNLGGFANISYKQKNKRVAYDICPVNIVLNELASQLGKAYDKGGMLAAKGKVNENLLKQLNNLSFYHQKGPKSLGKEWVVENVFKLFDNYKKISISDKLATMNEHIALQIIAVLGNTSKVLITGGGSKNNFLIKTIQQKTKAPLVLPANQLVDFKEALIFAFLGMLRVEKKNNALSSVTGAIRDSIGGCVYSTI